MNISIILPTRKRPENLDRLFTSIYETSNPDNIEVCSRIDFDDKESFSVLEAWTRKLGIRICVGEREECFGNNWNDAWKIARGDIFMMCGDDFVFQTKDWDLRIVEEFNKHKNHIAFVYGEDGIQHGAIGTHGFVSREWTNALGYFVPMDFKVFYHDTWLTEIARRIGKCIYLPELYFEHKHYSTGKSPLDENYQRMTNMSQGDGRIWNETEWKREMEANKLRALL